VIRQADGERDAHRAPLAALTGAAPSPDRPLLRTMSPQIPSDCPHELRPGVTVCLHCRRAEQEAARQRQTRTGMRVGAVALVVAVGAGLVSTRGGEVQVGAGMIAVADSALLAEPLVVATVDSQPVVRASTAEKQTVTAPRATAKPAKKPVPLAPLVALGRTDVGDGLYIERSEETVTVHFDTPETRTRRRDKFERVVRRTLPEIYGSAAEALLSSIPEGALVEPVDLVTEIAERGVELDAGNGWKVALWPETRPGEDGPLVVSYRVAVTR
jgi:hypothetical protein